MKKIIAALFLAGLFSPVHADPVTVDMKAEAFGYDTHPGIHFETKANFYLNTWNNTDQPQPMSVVYLHCVDGGGCVQGADTHTIEPHGTWSHTWHLSIPGVEYGPGEYNNSASMDVRVDSTGEHYRRYNRQGIRSHY